MIHQTGCTYEKASEEQILEEAGKNCGKFYLGNLKSLCNPSVINCAVEKWRKEEISILEDSSTQGTTSLSQTIMLTDDPPKKHETQPAKLLTDESPLQKPKYKVLKKYACTPLWSQTVSQLSRQTDANRSFHPLQKQWREEWRHLQSPICPSILHMRVVMTSCVAVSYPVSAMTTSRDWYSGHIGDKKVTDTECLQCLNVEDISINLSTFWGKS